jgi:hypothetical protein
LFVIAKVGIETKMGGYASLKQGLEGVLTAEAASYRAIHYCCYISTGPVEKKKG